MTMNLSVLTILLLPFPVTKPLTGKIDKKTGLLLSHFYPLWNPY